MAISTHCLPAGTLGANEIPVCNVSAANTSVLLPAGGLGNGNIRGVVVAMHGLSVVYQPVPPVGSIGNVTIAGYSGGSGADMEANLLADGWIVLGVPYPEDFYSGIGATAIWNDVNSDSGNGSRYLANQMHWWDHIVEFIHTTYDPDIPIVPFGGSWGGYHALQVAINRQSTIIAYCSDVPATIVSNASPAYTSPANYGPNQVVAGHTFTTPLANGTGGLDVQTTALNPGYTSQIGVTNPNGVTIPGCVLYGTGDGAVGWEITSSLPGVIPISSNTDTMLTNATANGIPVVRIQTNNYHEMTNADAGYSATYIDAGPTTLTSINSSGKLDIQDTGGGAFSPGIISGKCGIWASDNQWHTISFTNFGFTNYTSTSVSDVTTLSGSILTLGSTSDLNRSSGYISVVTSGTSLLASFSSVVGNTLHGVTYVSGSGAIAPTTSGYTGGAVVTLVNYCVTSATNVSTVSGATFTLSSTLGLNPTGGTITIATDKVFEGIFLPAVFTYATVSGSTITSVTYVSGGSFFGFGNITGGANSTVSLITPLSGVTIAGASGGATVSGGSPVSNYGIAVPGGFMNMSFPYWFSQYVDPIAPRKF